MSSSVSVIPTPLTSAAPAAQPVVMIEGVPVPEMHAMSYVAAAPLDARSVRCGVSTALWERRHTLIQRRACVALPHALSDGSTRWEVLASGVLRLPKHHRRSGTDDRTLELVDDWAERLDRPIGAGWAWASGALERVASVVLGVGDSANRSHKRHAINGRSIYITERGGAAWTVGEALDTLAAFADISLETRALSQKARAARLPLSLKLDAPLGDALRRLLGSAGWVVRAAHWRVGLIERASQAAVPASSGRRFSLPWGADQAWASRVAKVDVRSLGEPPRRWIMRSATPEVESTFTLSPGWDPALEGQPDAAYGRSTSTDFSRLGSVYRRWVLNEDGAFSSSPFTAGPAFDLAALFQDPFVVASPLRIGTCLTRNPSGRRLAPIVQVSIDSGATWSRYEGSANLLQDRAGLLFEDDVLPAAVLSAAKTGQLQARITGTLRSPRPLEQARWQGNPFARTGPDRLIERGRAYRWQRIDNASIHADAIDLGELEADEVDDRLAMMQDLLAAMSSQQGAGLEATVELIGAWPTISPGDRVLDVGGPGLNAQGDPTSVSHSPARVAEVRIDFAGHGNTPLTRLVLAE